ncbi:uncharacterized protein [Elaeis guineensis]|uniref:uncharacterized protein n=1 Tax=Elaeis guineensis var. tenera TaxID=51953 RepID=UPI003C6D22F1
MEWLNTFYKRLHVFGCVAYTHVPSELCKKLDDKNEKCIFIGYSTSVTKGYRLYNLVMEKVIVSEDVTFDEIGEWNWSIEEKKKFHFIQEDEEFTIDSLQPADCDPKTFAQASCDEGWIHTMDEKICAIEKNNTWKLSSLLEGKKSIRANPDGEILMVCLYVDDLIFTGDSQEMIDSFREAMIRDFEMTDMGLMSYFLSLEEIQSEKDIFVSQKKYAMDVLEKFKMINYNPILTPTEARLKLTKEVVQK